MILTNFFTTDFTDFTDLHELFLLINNISVKIRVISGF